MAVSLGFHIVFAALGIGLPLLLVFTEFLAIRRHDDVWMALTRRWSKALGILVAVGAVSGTVLSFALGLFWPGLMGRWGAVIGLPFALEAFAFFIEAIFIGIYLYGWDRLTPWAHWFSGWPVVLGGAASAWFVVTANSWMQSPVGFELSANGKVVDVQPIQAMLNPSTPVMTTHMILAGYMATGLTVASIYAVGMLKGRRDLYHRRALAVGLTFGLVLAPVQVFVGDLAAKLVAERQPMKLAALEGLWDTTADAPLTIGGIPLPGREETILGIRIPGALSWLAFGDTGAVVQGLKEVPPQDRPNTILVHLAFQVMVAIGFAFLGLGVLGAGRVVATRPSGVARRPLVPARGRRRGPRRVHRARGRMDRDRGRAPAVDRLRPDADGRRRDDARRHRLVAARHRGHVRPAGRRVLVAPDQAGGQAARRGDDRRGRPRRRDERDRAGGHGAARDRRRADALRAARRRRLRRRRVGPAGARARARSRALADLRRRSARCGRRTTSG